MGDLYFNGDGKEVPQDFKQAVYWYTKAAEQGFANAQYRLGYMYDYGDEIPQDYKQAFFWYTKAAEQGHYFAKEHREEMLKRMSQSQIEEVRKLSKEFYERNYMVREYSVYTSVATATDMSDSVKQKCQIQS